VLGISIDPPIKSHEMAVKLNLPFQLLSDPDLKTINGFGVQDGKMARPSTFVVDRAGFIRWSYLGEDRADRPFNDTILSQLNQMN